MSTSLKPYQLRTHRPSHIRAWKHGKQNKLPFCATKIAAVHEENIGGYALKPGCRFPCLLEVFKVSIALQIVGRRKVEGE
jgi:hypothetical protein